MVNVFPTQFQFFRNSVKSTSGGQNMHVKFHFGMDEQTDGGMNEWTNERTSERTDGPINRQLFKKSKVGIIFTGQKNTIIAAKETLGVFSLSGKRKL
jgi:hypothetical protein